MTEDAVDTAMSRLMARRQQIANEQALSLRIPLWDDPQIKVTYRPLSQLERNKAMQQLIPDEGEKRDIEEQTEASLNANADTLAKACIKVELRSDDPELSGTFDGFDDQLAQTLGLPPRARTVVRTLFIRDGDLWTTVDKLLEFSGFINNKIDEEFSGE